MCLCTKENPKIVVIIGATGTGKSKLAIDLCRRFDGEVVSADSMQVYEGLDIVTCKVSRSDMAGVPHHLMSFLPPQTVGYTVVDFRNNALKAIDAILSRSKIPMIVGGTFYYVESLIWSNLISADKAVLLEDDDYHSSPFYDDLPDGLLSMTDEQLHAELRAVDPERALHLHPNNRRRVVRSLQVWYSTHKTHTQLLKEQHQTIGANGFGGAPRFNQVCIIWLQCEKSILDIRLRQRISSMVEQGLKNELTCFVDEHYPSFREKPKRLPKDCDRDSDESKGVFQCIGLKQFSDFLSLPVDQRNSASGDAAFRKGLELLLVATRQYAKRQLKWIKNRFVKRPLDDGFKLFALDVTLDDNYEAAVLGPATEIVRSFLNGHPSTIQPLRSKSDSDVYSYDEDANRHRLCEVCDRLIANSQWQSHILSRSHRKRTGKRCKQSTKCVAGDHEETDVHLRSCKSSSST
ncbi:unnamed protein product [Soboliphyme baturini]|uniref:tRNA dimethylallyltransferase n=1 Tax=Soboliphyme baturini TaxID=241478 RepID=A0A183J606_9BILA|nr:unnamed protein product [Soboliphyme baturini]